MLNPRYKLLYACNTSRSSIRCASWILLSELLQLLQQSPLAGASASFNARRHAGQSYDALVHHHRRERQPTRSRSRGTYTKVITLSRSIRANIMTWSVGICLHLRSVQTVRDHCFKMCITSPGSSLSSSEQKCLGRCMDRYQDVSHSEEQVASASLCLTVAAFDPNVRH